MVTTSTKTQQIMDLKGTMSVKKIATEVGVSRTYVYKVNGKSNHRAPLIAVYRFIESYRRENKVAPSMLDIAAAFPAKSGEVRSTSVVNYWLTRMQKLKMVAPRQFGRVRDLNLLPLNKRNSKIAALLEAEEGDSNG